MPFIPHTDEDIQEMLTTIGINKIEDLFDEIPEALRHPILKGLPAGLSEMELSRLMKDRAMLDANLMCFIGAGAYEHYIPAAVWDVATRGEFYSAYTPYQPEASQGNLQLIYEYQTMMARLMGMELSNASLYDGASSLAEAVLMAVRLSGKKPKLQVLLPRSIHPFYRQTVKSIVKQQGIELIEVPYQKDSGRIDQAVLEELITNEVAALVIPQPNFFGVLEDVDALTNLARDKNILSIACVNPMAMALLKPPGNWGTEGVDIACGDGQPLGIPLASGGPYYGFLCCKKIHVRQMPGRIVGRTTDREGSYGYVLTLQAREQHIRRAKATSNICTNQGLMVTASTIYMSLMGPMGLRHIANLCHQKARELQSRLLMIPGVQNVFNGPFFHEMVIQCDQSTDNILRECAQERIQIGFPLNQYYPELPQSLLICATETKTARDIEHLGTCLDTILNKPMSNGGKRVCQA